MKALIVIDVQNEFTASGQRPVPGVDQATAVIKNYVEQARMENTPIAWIRHFNKPDESPAFVPGTWGAEFISGFAPKTNTLNEVEMHKDVYGAFTGTKIGKWLSARGIEEVLIMGFYTHGCVSTTSREAIMAGFAVSIDPNATGSCDMEHELLGTLTAAQSKNAALLQLANMGVTIASAVYA